MNDSLQVVVSYLLHGHPTVVAPAVVMIVIKIWSVGISKAALGKRPKPPSSPGR
jgi:hypothetical protein